MKLPKGWTKFKIVETQEGCFTGQVTTNSIDDFNEEDRLKLVQYTRDYIEHHTKQKVEKYETV